MPASPCSGEGRVQTDVHLGASAWRGSTNWTLECSGKTLLDGALNGKAGRFGLSDDFLNTDWVKLAILRSFVRVSVGAGSANAAGGHRILHLVLGERWYRAERHAHQAECGGLYHTFVILVWGRRRTSGAGY